MRKNNILLVLSLCLTFSACNSNESERKFDINAWSSKLINNSLIEINNYDYTNKKYLVYEKYFLKDKVDESFLNQYGILLVTTGPSEVGLYSMIYNKWFINPFNVNDYTLSIEKNKYTNFLIKINKNNNYSCYDSFGNEIYKNSKFPREVTYDIVKRGNKEQIYCYHSDDNYIPTITKLYYSDDGKINKRIEFLDDENVKNKDDEIYLKLKKIINDYEYEGNTFFLSNKLLTSYNKKGKIISSYKISNGIDNFYIAGKSLIYQTIEEISEDTKKFTYYDIDSKDKKYLLKSYKLDLLSGKKKEIELDYKIFDWVKKENKLGTPLFETKDSLETPVFYNDKRGRARYSLINANFINEDKNLSNKVELLVDETGDIVLNATNFAADRFIKLKNGNYYNLDNKIIYDKSLNIIVSLKEYTTIDYYSGLGFVTNKNDKFGLLSDDGKTLLENKYNFLGKHVYNRNIFAIKEDGNAYKVNIDTKKEEFLVESAYYSFYFNGLYGFKNDEASYYKDLNGFNYEIVDKNHYIYYGGTYSSDYGKYRFYLVDDNNNYNQRKFIAFSNDLISNYDTLETIYI